MNKVSTVVDAADDLRNAILAALHNVSSHGERLTLIAAYLDTVIEHHDTITNAIRRGAFGSAFALARPVYDSSLRAFWVNACATDEQVRELVTYDHHDRVIPRGNDLYSKLDATYGLNNQIQSLKGKWEAMSSYTHSGLRQLGRRGFRGAKPHGYTPRAIIEIVDFSTSSLASLARVYINAAGNALWALFVTAMEKDYYAAA